MFCMYILYIQCACIDNVEKVREELLCFKYSHRLCVKVIMTHTCRNTVSIFMVQKLNLMITYEKYIRKCYICSQLIMYCTDIS